MKMQPDVELMTIKDIAERISLDRSDRGVERTMRQVRHWTQCDLLRTVGRKNTGKGIPRLYEEEPTMLIAAILLELSLYGATVEILSPVAEGLYEHSDEDGMYLFHATTDVNTYLQVEWVLDPASGKFIDAEIHFFDKLDRKDGQLLLSEYPSSSILINMTMVAERIYCD